MKFIRYKRYNNSETRSILANRFCTLNKFFSALTSFTVFGDSFEEKTIDKISQSANGI